MYINFHFSRFILFVNLRVGITIERSQDSRPPLYGSAITRRTTAHANMENEMQVKPRAVFIEEITSVIPVKSLWKNALAMEKTAEVRFRQCQGIERSLSSRLCESITSCSTGWLVGWLASPGAAGFVRVCAEKGSSERTTKIRYYIRGEEAARGDLSLSSYRSSPRELPQLHCIVKPASLADTRDYAARVSAYGSQIPGRFARVCIMGIRNRHI